MRTVAFLLACISLAACVPRDILKHYESRSADAVPSSDELSRQFKPSIFTTVPDQRTTLILDKLSPEGQQAYIRALSKGFTAEGTAVIKLIASPMPSSSRVCGWADLTGRQIRVIFTMDGNQSKPADRFENLDFSLEKQGGDFEFSSWDRFETTYSTVNLGSDSLVRGSKFTFGADSNDYDPNNPATVTPDASLLKIGGESSVTRTEAASYAARKAAVNGVLLADKATISQRAAPNSDLLGNVFATLTLRLRSGKSQFTAFKFPELYKDGNFVKPETVAFETCSLKVPRDVDSNLTAGFSVRGSLRYVQSGDDTYRESDDSVSFVDYSPSVAPMTLLEKSGLEYRVFAISTGGDAPSKTLAWRQLDGGASTLPMLFIDEQHARDVLAWLQDRQPGSLMGRAVVLVTDNGEVLMKNADYATLKVVDVTPQNIKIYSTRNQKGK